MLAAKDGKKLIFSNKKIKNGFIDLDLCYYDELFVPYRKTQEKYGRIRI